VVSTKFTAGDFFSYLPLNPTLAEGHHRRVVELQAKPEFEGFSAFPNFLGAEHGRALRALTTANPKIIGTYVLSQFGGPLRAGPRLLYPLHGFWLWTDANAFVASRLASNPSADVDGLTREWARMRFGQDEGVVEAIADMLTRTREAVLKGFYIRAFAEREVRVPGLEVPPLMWIFEWDMVGGWHSLLSLVYSASRETAVEAIEEGQAAARAVREARQQLRTALASRSDRVCTQSCDQVLRSLEYQETLFDALAAWRRAFLGYYQWIETGGDEAWSHWLEGRAQFDATVERHSIAFGSDYDFPAFDFTSASRAIATAHAGTLARGAAASALAALVLALCLQSPFGTLLRATTLMPWRIDRAGRSASMFAAAFVLLLIGLVAMLLSGLTTPLPALLAVLVAIVAATAFDAITMRGIESRKRASVLVAPLAPQLPGIAVLLALMAYFGPLAFWYEFWTSSVFRLVFVTVVLAVPMWTVFVMLAWSSRVSWYRRIGGTLAAAGAVSVTLAALLPDWVVTLRSFDRPLNFAPATATMLFALDTYVGVELHVAPVSWLVGTLLVAGGYTLSWLPLTGTNRSSELLDRQLDALPAKATGNRLDDPAQH
jgi:hypothetical protein